MKVLQNTLYQRKSVNNGTVNWHMYLTFLLPYTKVKKDKLCMRIVDDKNQKKPSFHLFQNNNKTNVVSFVLNSCNFSGNITEQNLLTNFK